MKKFFTLVALALAVASGVNAQTYNLFPQWAVDSNGWLWFDTADKISAFVGKIDEDNYAVKMDGKIVQMAGANHGEYEETVASAETVGVAGTGNDAAVGAPGSKTGSIVLAAASGLGADNGGGLLLKLPSLSTLSVNLSSIHNKGLIVLATKAGEGKDLSQYEQKFLKYKIGSAWIGRLAGAGLFEWNGVEKLTFIDNTFSLVSNDPVYVFIQNTSFVPIYIHGIKVMTPKQEATGISVVNGGEAVSGKVMVYSLDGTLVKSNADANEVQSLPKGVYMVRQGGVTKKVAVN
ncbi:MAG: T9SS type A sorting domain-containing protein [Prevotella sp.]|nr:T9SS type A sorting domain-containing protein [Prevotella sp.]